MMLTNKIWNVSEESSLDHSDALLDVLLNNRHISDDEVKDLVSDNPTMWHDPFLYKDMDKAVELLSNAIANK